jgi:hypothetical protein
MQHPKRLFLGVFLITLFCASPRLIHSTALLELATSQKQLDIPESMAKVIDAYWIPPETLPQYILIQDAHRFPQVQSRIASLIVQGYERWGVKKVFVEGAFTSLDFSIFHRVPKMTQAYLMERLVKEGDLSGPELAAVLIMEREWRNPPVSPFQIFGMDDPKLYRQNIQAYQAVLAQRDRALEEIVSIRRLQVSMRLSDQSPLSQQLSRVESLIRLKITPSEYETYLKTKANTPSAPALDPAIRSAEEFYRLVQLRSQAFLREASRKVPASTSPRVLVVGGFHTAAMANLLRQANISFVVLSPHVTSDNGEPIYERRMQKTANVLAEALVPPAH